MALSREPGWLTIPVSSRDHCQGNSTAKTTLVQYGNYQCPAGQAAHCVVQTLQQQLGDQLRFVFRHFPQSHLHPDAYHAAEAVEAAASQNKFWEMHSHLLEHQSQLADNYLVQYAIALYLNVNQFLQEMASDLHVARVQADIDGGIQSGVTQTPTFFIDGRKYTDEQGLEALLEAVIQANRQ